MGRFGILGALIAICIGSFEASIQKSLDLGLEVLIIRATFINRMKGLMPYCGLRRRRSLGKDPSTSTD